jgi:hypothetical protein
LLLVDLALALDLVCILHDCAGHSRCPVCILRASFTPETLSVEDKGRGEPEGYHVAVAGLLLEMSELFRMIG